MKRHLQLLLSAVLFIGLNFSGLHAQNGRSQDYETELSYGALFHTNGGFPGGGMLKFSKLAGEDKPFYHTFRLEAVNIKHPKEVKTRTQVSFFWGKQNYLYILRPMYGREYVLFKKAPKQGVQVNFFACAGPSLGFVAPYLLQYEFDGQIIKTSQYNPAIHTNYSFVRGTGSFADSFSQARIQPGLAMKTAISFEFGAFKNSVSGFEAGFSMDAYPKTITLYPSVKGNKVFLGIYVGVYYGNKR